MKLNLVLIAFVLFVCFNSVSAAPSWEARLDGQLSFYQTTDFGVLLAATENSLYAIDGATGEIVWRRRHKNLNQSAITPVPGTDLILLSLEERNKSRVSALDLLTGKTIWTSDKVKGRVLQLAAEPEQNLLCTVLVKDPRGKTGETLKREPQVAVFDLASGDLLWKRDLGGAVEMMPAEFAENQIETDFTLDNYRAPLILDERLFLFYEGATSFEARTGKEREREKFKINENGLALTEADPVFDNDFIYTSGRGRVRAVRRDSGQIEWEAKDLGVTPQIVVGDNVLYVRTGGQFTRMSDGETINKGPFGASAIDRQTGKVLWRFKGADRGLTNFVFSDANTILIADRDDLIAIDAATGKRIGQLAHRVDDAQFVLINEKGQAVVGGREQLAAFEIQNLKSKIRNPQPVWTARYRAPGRGALAIIGSIALRATALYFRYGGIINAGFNVFQSASLIRSAAGLRWSGVNARISNFDLTSLATNASKNVVVSRIRTFGIASRFSNANSIGNFGGATTPSLPRAPNVGTIAGNVGGRNAPTGGDLQESLLDRLDPARQANRLADWLTRRQRLSELRGNFMYFYTNLERGGKGLVGVNLTNGNPQRQIRLGDPDARFVTDEVAGLLYSTNGERLQAFALTNE